MLREKELCEGSRLCNDDPSIHADDCPVTLLHEAMHSAAGILLDRALNTEFACEHFRVDLDDIPADEYNAFRVLQTERNKHEREQLEKDKHKWPKSV